MQKRDDLSDVDRTIIRMIAQGYPIPRIAEHIGWGVKTVKKTVKMRVLALQRQFGVSDRRELVYAANRRGLLE